MAELCPVIPLVLRTDQPTVDYGRICPVIPFDLLSHEEPRIIVNAEGNLAYDLSSIEPDSGDLFPPDAS